MAWEHSTISKTLSFLIRCRRIMVNNKHRISKKVLHNMFLFSGYVDDHSSPIISFLGIFSLLGQSHVEQGREDEGQCGDEDGRDQLRKGWNRWFLLWKASVLFSSYLKDAGEGGQGLGEEEKQGDDQGAEDRPLDRELWYVYFDVALQCTVCQDQGFSNSLGGNPIIFSRNWFGGLRNIG